jgi:hypothetical protein
MLSCFVHVVIGGHWALPFIVLPYIVVKYFKVYQNIKHGPPALMLYINASTIYLHVVALTVVVMCRL